MVRVLTRGTAENAEDDVSVTVPPSPLVLSKLFSSTFLAFSLSAFPMTMTCGAESANEIKWAYSLFNDFSCVGKDRLKSGSAIDPGTAGIVRVPSFLGGYPVRKIGMTAFAGCTNITEVFVPEGVEAIGFSAFNGCRALTAIALPESLTEIGPFAFDGCCRLLSVSLPDSVQELPPKTFAFCGNLRQVVASGLVHIRAGAFTECVSLEDFVFPESLSDIGWAAFDGCRALSRIRIPKGVTRIDGYAFATCVGLKEVIFSGEIKHIGENAFSGCGELRSIRLPKGLDTIRPSLFEGCVSLEECEIPIGCTGIGECAFSGCAALRSVAIPDTVTEIGRKAFRGCRGLRSIVIPASVTSIGADAFLGCKSLSEIRVGSGNKTFCTENGFLMTKDKRRLIFCCGGGERISVPSGIMEIDSGAFSGCRVIRQIDLPSSVRTIKADFSECAFLTNITVASDNSLFQSKEGMLLSEDGKTLVRCPMGISRARIPSGVVQLMSRSFAGCINLGHVSFPESLREIGEMAFEGCAGLTAVDLPDGIIEIGDSAFQFCRGIKTLRLPSGLLRIGDFAFSGCSGLSEVYVPELVSKIGFSVFLECDHLRHVVINAQDLEIGACPFVGCRSLQAVVFKGNAPKTEDFYEGTPDDVVTYVTRETSGWPKDDSQKISVKWYDRTIQFADTPDGLPPKGQTIKKGSVQ